MEKVISEKMDALLKYIPFIDFLLNIDKQKYIKFINIKKWIILKKKKYPLSDLNKIEKSIITQYQNILVEDKVRIPASISKIFAPLKFKEYVNLCSDEEDNDEESNTNKNTAQVSLLAKGNDCIKSKLKTEFSSTTNNRNQKAANAGSDDDDDVEIISIDYIDKQKESTSHSLPLNNACKVKKDYDLSDDISNDILSKIDKLTGDEMKSKIVHEPVNYCYQANDNNDNVEIGDNTAERALIQNSESTTDNVLFQRRTDFKNDKDNEVVLHESVELFERRTDFKDEVHDETLSENVKNNRQNTTEKEGVLFERRKHSKVKSDDDEVVVESLIKKMNTKSCNTKSAETISLDSDSEDELYNDKPSTSKAAATALKAKKGLASNQCSVEENTKTTSKEDGTTADNSEEVDSICDSIDFAFEKDIDILNELRAEIQTNPAKEHNVNKNGISNKENLIRPNVREAYTQLLKLIETALDIPVDSILAALTNAKNHKTKEENSLETPPPAPPAIMSIPNTPSVNFNPLQQQQQQQHQTHITHNPHSLGQMPFQTYPPSHLPHIPAPAQQAISPVFQNPNSNVVVSQAVPPAKKVNIKDPRIQRQLQVIQKSPLFNCNLINTNIAESIMNICREQAGQQMAKAPQQHQPPHTMNNLPTLHQQNVLSNKTYNTSAQSIWSKSSSETVSTISYGEYKRRKMEEKLQMERLREEEEKKKTTKPQILNKEEEEKERKTKPQTLNKDDLRSQILSTLNPCKDQIANMWKQHRNKESKTVEHISQQNLISEKGDEENEEETEVQEMITINKAKKSRKTTKSNKNKKIDTEEKLNRIYRELHCTVKGFDQLHDYVPKPTDSKRHSSAQARINIENQLNNSNSPESSFVAEESQKQITTPRPIGLKRRSSIHALSAISEQLANSQSEDIDINIDHTQSTQPEERSQTLKRRKTIDEIIKPTKRCHVLRIDSSESSSSSSEDATDTEYLENLKKLKQGIIKNPGYVKLERISQKFIRNHTKRESQDDTHNLLNVHLVKLDGTLEKMQKSLDSPNAKKPNKPRRFNNDCQMTERNTRFCVLCTSKPSDLTNHYIRKHKTESYVARLDWSELDDLKINPPFAKLQPQTSSNRAERYAVECPFCKEQLMDAFMNLYNHYASHTGEYAYQCSHCHLLKPYRADIQSHLLHSKTCRNAHVQVMYRYPYTQCIYLHYCDICNFVQLNEANIIKHIREHHYSSKAIAANVGKCILTAVSDGPVVENSALNKTPSSQAATAALTEVAEQNKNLILENLKTNCALKFKVDDDDVPICNEPCSEDIFDDNKISLEEHLRQIHEDPPNIQKIPMTVVHCTENLRNNLSDSEQFYNPSNTNSSPHRHLKVEPLEINENIIQTPPRPLPPPPATNCLTDVAQTSKVVSISQPEGYTVYEKYRCYKETVDYLGLHKCMIDDCYYSTDCPNEMLKHFADHAIDSPVDEYLQCPYCIIPMNNKSSLTAEELVEHVRLKHQHMNYQCSLCCYRSCEASNVLVHQRSHHSDTNQNCCKIYKCPANDEDNNSQRRQIDLDQLITKNVMKISCSFCHASFYNSNLLAKHISSAHNLSYTSLKLYSCIRCHLTGNNIKQLRLHVATKHPEEIPYIYDHNGQVNRTEDALTSLNIINLSEPVANIKLATAVVNQNVEETGVMLQDNADVKPDLAQLQQINEEIIKVRLRKLTNHTGVPPDTLYRCPISTCGGFFSIFDSWLKHMRKRHTALECKCPHCPATEATSPTMLPLESFRSHFEEHRRHTFLCFYCTFTCRNNQMALQHAHQEHSIFGIMRFEQIRFNINYSYSIMIQHTLFTKREDFINEFLVILEQRLKDMETMEMKLLKSQWPLDNSVAVWLENFPKFLLTNRRTTIRCLVKTCTFRSFEKTALFQHLLAKHEHEIKDNSFFCKKCNYRLDKIDGFEKIYDHIKIHSESMFICAACSVHSSSRSKVSQHIIEQHAARDVAVVELLKMDEQIYNKIYIVFANNHLTFSTMKNCFCCPERNMSGNVLALHLKHYHNLVFNHYCEKCIHFQFNSLKEVKGHFQQFHKEENIKIRCELAAKSDLSVTALNEFQVEISKANNPHPKQNDKLLIKIKEEPYDSANNDDDDDCVMLLEDDDIVIQNSLKDENKVEKTPQLKCIALSNLMNEANKNINNTCNNNTAIVSNLPQQQQLITSQNLNYTTNQQQQQSPSSMSLPSFNVNSNNLLTTGALNTFNSVPNNSNHIVSSTASYIATPATNMSNVIVNAPKTSIGNHISHLSNSTANTSGNYNKNPEIVQPNFISTIVNRRPTLRVVQINPSNKNSTSFNRPHLIYVRSNAQANPNYSTFTSQVVQHDKSNHQYVQN